MIATEFTDLINQLKKIDINNTIDYYEIVDKEVELLTRNVDETLEFISQLTDELEFVYMSETLVKIASKERNDTIIKAYEKITEKFPNALKRFNIKNIIEYAKQRI